MAKTVTLRLKDEIYEKFSNLAKNDNRPLSNFIETAVLRFIENAQYVNSFEMDEIINNSELNESLKKAHEDVKKGSGEFV
ncbi:MAG: CopG family transcriptional regulator [Candidatus Marinimicrobia bacterium]|nr:CopG family transcriptional regulator [Candidatus Neomarinimicrobiota bacterium]MCH7762626.1 CopG family transcriptional regulator [Candidatus Neomarinimicrobiota bacterium]